MTESVLELLSDWGEARVDEISEVVQHDREMSGSTRRSSGNAGWATKAAPALGHLPTPLTTEHTKSGRRTSFSPPVAGANPGSLHYSSSRAAGQLHTERQARGDSLTAACVGASGVNQPRAPPRCRQMPDRHCPFQPLGPVARPRGAEVPAGVGVDRSERSMLSSSHLVTVICACFRGAPVHAAPTLARRRCWSSRSAVAPGARCHVRRSVVHSGRRCWRRPRRP